MMKIEEYQVHGAIGVGKGVTIKIRATNLEINDIYFDRSAEARQIFDTLNHYLPSGTYEELKKLFVEKG